MVIAPANTGSEINRRIAVISTDQQNSGVFSIVISFTRMFIIVEIKLIAPKIDLIPAM